MFFRSMFIAVITDLSWSLCNPFEMECLLVLSLEIECLLVLPLEIFQRDRSLSLKKLRGRGQCVFISVTSSWFETHCYFKFPKEGSTACGVDCDRVCGSLFCIVICGSSTRMYLCVVFAWQIITSVEGKCTIHTVCHPHCSQWTAVFDVWCQV